MGNELYIEDQRADLSGENLIAITYQVNNLADLKDRQSTFSNSIKLPLSAINKKIWGYAHLDAFTQQQPYQKLKCKLVQNGIEVIVNGTISLLSVSDSFECQITYGVSGINDALKKKTLNAQQEVIDIQDAKLVDMDWSDIPNFFYDLPTIVASQNNVGVLWPVIDYGDTLTDSSTINATYLRPGVYHRQILEHIQAYTGYSFSGGAAYVAGFSDFTPFSDNILYDYLGNSASNLVPISIVKNLPDFTLKNFLKDYMQRYFLTPIVDNYKKTVVFRNFDELYQNKATAKDWTDKFINDSRTDTFEFGEYAQLNRLLWVEDSQSENVFANGVFYINNENLDSDKDLVTSIFAPTDNAVKLGGKTVAHIKKFDESPLPNYGTPFQIETKPRVINIQNASFGNWIFDFTNGQQVNPTAITGIARSYQYQIDNFGQGFLKLLYKARAITRYAVLTERDVKDFDFFTPIYDGKECKYYYVNKISNFIPGKRTQIELIRM